MNDDQKYFEDLAADQRMAGAAVVILMLAAGAALTVLGLAQRMM